MMTILASLVALAWTLLAVRNVRNARKIHFLQAIEGPIPDDLPDVAAIVPARNEEAHVERTVRALLAQDYPRFQAIFVDDRSTDQTGAILDRLARELPIRVLHGEPRPPGWVGKTWAVAQGARSVEAEWILFVDADMGLHPRALASAVDRARRSGADLVSIVARPEIRSFWQGAVALAIGQIIFSLYPLHRVNDPDCRAALAAGGFLLVRRSIYEKVGGHEAVRSEIVEDIQMARTIKEAGGRLSVHLAPELAWTHMYGSFGEIWRGLRKNAYAGMEYHLHKFFVGLIVALAMVWTPYFGLVRGGAAGAWPLAIAGLWGVAAQLIAIVPSTVFLRISPAFALTFPFGASAYLAIICSSVWNHHRGRILWKDVAFEAREVERASYRGPTPATIPPNPPGPLDPGPTIR